MPKTQFVSSTGGLKAYNTGRVDWAVEVLIPDCEMTQCVVKLRDIWLYPNRPLVLGDYKHQIIEVQEGAEGFDIVLFYV